MGRWPLWIVLACAGLMVAGLGAGEFRAPDESRYALAGLRMATGEHPSQVRAAAGRHSRRSDEPRGTPSTAAPVVWATSAAFRMLPESEWSGRLAPAAAGLLA